jgi:hypothetical protein
LQAEGQHVAREVRATQAPASLLAREPAAGTAGSGGVGSGGGGGASDAAYDDVLRRVRQEQEQLGQLIDHPF